MLTFNKYDVCKRSDAKEQLAFQAKTCILNNAWLQYNFYHHFSVFKEAHKRQYVPNGVILLTKYQRVNQLILI